jgi:glycosyltransferase involved in cell wall biosynthesis
VSPSLLWVVHDVGCNPGALAAYWGSAILGESGWRVMVQPLVAPLGPPLSGDWQHVNVPLSPRPMRWTTKAKTALQSVISSFDRILCDQDFETERRVLEVANGRANVYLLGRQTRPPAPSHRALYAQLDGILTVSRVAYAQFAQSNVVLASRLHCLPPLVNWREKPGQRPRMEHGLTAVTAGIVDSLKGLDLVLNALGVLRDQGFSAALTVLGDGPERTRLEVYARALGVRVQFVPRWSGWANWIAGSDCLLAPQFDDSLAFDVDAAVSLGVPVIGHALPVVVERASVQPEALLLDDMSVMAIVDALQGRKRRPLLHATPADRLEPWVRALTLAP